MQLGIKTGYWMMRERKFVWIEQRQGQSFFMTADGSSRRNWMDWLVSLVFLVVIPCECSPGNYFY